MKVAILGYRLARNHALPDGNKRTARPTGDVGADRQSSPVGTGTMSDVTTIYVGSWSELAKHTRPPTDDDVPVTGDGRRLDTPDKVRAFVEELKQQLPVDADA